MLTKFDTHVQEERPGPPAEEPQPPAWGPGPPAEGPVGRGTRVMRVTAAIAVGPVCVCGRVELGVKVVTHGEWFRHSEKTKVRENSKPKIRLVIYNVTFMLFCICSS